MLSNLLTESGLLLFHRLVLYGIIVIPQTRHVGLLLFHRLDLYGIIVIPHPRPVWDYCYSTDSSCMGLLFHRLVLYGFIAIPQTRPVWDFCYSTDSSLTEWVIVFPQTRHWLSGLLLFYRLVLDWEWIVVNPQTRPEH